MTQTRRSGSARNGAAAAWHACRALTLAALLPVLAAAAATAQEGAPAAPPPDQAPVSRLTITPYDFERWLAGTPERPDVAGLPEDQPPSLVTAPPPPPVLAPPPPALTPRATPKPPQPAAATPAPAAAPGAPPATRAATPEPGAVSPPAPPLLTPPESPQVATLPPDSPATTPVPAPPDPLARPGEIRILYAADATDLPEQARRELDRIAAWLRANPGVRVQIVGYASESAKAGSQARRRSLFRTLAVRTYLIENGVLSTRMDVRAMGDRTEEEPKDRVEVKLPPT